MPSDTKNVKLGVCKLTLGGVDLGYTKGGVEVEVTSETHKVMVDQFGNSEINEYITGRTCMVRAPLAESTLENMVKIMPGATLTETGGTQATGSIDLGVANPADGDTLTINGVVFTFKDVPAGDFEIQTEASVAAALTTAVAKLAASTAPSVSRATYGESTTQIDITYATKSVDGNAFTIAASNAGHTASGATLTGGVDSKKRVDATNAIGQDLLSVAQELKLHPVANLASNVADDFTVPLASTAGALSFAYKLDEERVYNVEFTGYPNPDTKLLFFVGDPTA